MPDLPFFYDKQTINSPNPLARFSHSHRLATSVALVSAEPGVHRLLDYGCGTGQFLKALQRGKTVQAIGYEPYMPEKSHASLPIYKNLNEIRKHAPFDLITIFETIEHLSGDEIKTFLALAEQILSPKGRILFSAPIEIGPALLLKTINRISRIHRWPTHPPSRCVSW